MIGFLKIKNKLLLLILLAVTLILLLVGILLFSSNNWLTGSGCVYDDGNGFIELSNGDSLPLEDGRTASCERGKIVFDE